MWKCTLFYIRTSTLSISTLLCGHFSEPCVHKFSTNHSCYSLQRGHFTQFCKFKNTTRKRNYVSNKYVTCYTDMIHFVVIIILHKTESCKQEDPTLTVKCGTAIIVMFIYFNLCLSVMLDSLSCSFTSISFLTTNCFFTLNYI